MTAKATASWIQMATVFVMNLKSQVASMRMLATTWRMQRTKLIASTKSRDMIAKATVSWIQMETAFVTHSKCLDARMLQHAIMTQPTPKKMGHVISVLAVSQSAATRCRLKSMRSMESLA